MIGGGLLNFVEFLQLSGEGEKDECFVFVANTIMNLTLGLYV